MYSRGPYYRKIFDEAGILGVVMNTDANSIYQKTYNAECGDVDFNKKVKISSLFNYFQDIASLHAENIGLGIVELQEKGVTWVLVKMLVQIDRIPVLNEQLFVETWPLKPKKLEFERDFYIKDINGNIICRAISSWIIMDVKSKEIQKTEHFPGNLHMYKSDRAIDERLSKIKSKGQPQQVYKKVIGYSDIDLNGHLNNSKYIDNIADCFSIEKHSQYSVDKIQVSYISEALAGDTIIFNKDISELESGIVYVEGVDETGAKTYFKACITLNNNTNDV